MVELCIYTNKRKASRVFL
jgi:hypothetical protein